MRRLVIGCRKVTFPSREYLGGLLSGVTSKNISYCLNVSMFIEDRCSLFPRKLLNYGRMRVCGKLTRSMPRDN